MNDPKFSGAGSAAGSGFSLRGIGLPNTVHSEVAPCLPLPSLPVFFGASDQDLRLFDGSGATSRSLDRREVLSQASNIADLLGETDVSYLKFKDDVQIDSNDYVEPLQLCTEVLKYNREAFEYRTPGHAKEEISIRTEPEKSFGPTAPYTAQPQKDHVGRQSHTYQFGRLLPDDTSTSSAKKPKSKKRGGDDVPSSSGPDPQELQDATIGNFSEILDDFCGRAEIPNDDRDDAEWLPLSLGDLRTLVSEIMSIRARRLLHLVPADLLVRLLRVLDHQIHRAEGSSIDEYDHSDSDVSLLIFSALESIHAALAVMAHSDMSKQLYKEEIIERILEFSRHQIVDVMYAYDPSYRALHKPKENGEIEEDEDEEFDAESGSASKKRRTTKNVKVKKSASNRVSTAMNTILQKLCTILGLLKDLLLIERLSDSCILQLVKTSFTTFLVDNIQLLQLKTIGLICGIFYSYTQHRTYVMDETLQLLMKLPVSKKALRSYHLPDEEQRQIQMISALLIQLIHHSANLPDALRQASAVNPILEVSIDAGYPVKSYEAATEACCLFWTRVLQRFTAVKNQDASELKVMMENLVMDLLTTLNLPEYPASSSLLEVLCVLLLQNAGLKSKDISARTLAIDLLGVIAARLKQDTVLCSRDNLWILQELGREGDDESSYPKDTCSVCMDDRAEKVLFTCQDCQRLFHADCLGVREHEVPNRSWYCQFCLCRKQILVLKSYSKSQYKDAEKQNLNSTENSMASLPISKVELVQHMLLNCLQDANSSDDVHLFVRWFYLCLWYKDDAKSEQKLNYYLSRLKSKAIVRDSGAISSSLRRDSVKKITLALGQNNSFSRGFDKILHMLLASLMENSPVIRAKALRAVSIIVEADPEVLRDKRVQSAVEGRFCDSAISVREAALELVGRHIASHPDVGLQYFQKVAERIKDTGVSVRKRAIKIVRDMCIANANFSDFTKACIDIISRISDDELSIQDLVCKTFYEFWFEEPTCSQTRFFGDGSSVPLEVAKKTEQIVEVLKKMPNNQLLVTIIKRNLALDFFPLSAKAVGINPVSLASVRKRCVLMCKGLLERILQVEEINSKDVELHTLPYVLALHAFCVVDPMLCSPSSDPSQFVVTLQPYLKTRVDNRVAAQLLESIICIVDAVLPSLKKLEQTVVEELEQDLKHMIIRHSFLTVVHACIKCLCSVSKVAGKGASVVEYLIQVFFKCLDTQITDNKQVVGRSLFCLGLLIRYGNSLLSMSCNQTVETARSLSLFKRYLSMDDFVLKSRALQALGFVLIARPEYMLEKDIGKILEATLSSGTDLRLKMQALQNMYEYLLDAENQMGGDKASSNVVNSSVSGGKSVPVAAGAGDTNICGGIVQLYWDNILGRCLDFNEQVRQTALKIVQIVLRQGLVHPITCVPYLIALETDTQEANAKLAHQLLMNMNEKYPAFFESRLGDGLQLSFAFMQSITGGLAGNMTNKVQAKLTGNMKGKSDAGSLAQARLGVCRIYKLIRGNRVSRNKFMSSIVRKFDNPSSNDFMISFLMYCTEILALLPFTFPDEPLYLIYAINRVIQVRAGALEANMKALILHFSQRDKSHVNGVAQQESATQSVSYSNHMSFDLNGTIQEEPFVEPPPSSVTSINLNGTIQQEQAFHSALDHGSSGEAGIKAMDSVGSSGVSPEDVQKIQVDCLSATALRLLLRLKRHLKIVYSLNDARCQAFSPTEPQKPGEVLSKQTIPFNVSDTGTSLATTYQELVQKYQEFKNALKEDTIDYSTFTATIKRKRPTPRKGVKPGKGTVAWNDDDEDDDEDYTGGQRLGSGVGGGRRSTRSRR